MAGERDDQAKDADWISGLTPRQAIESIISRSSPQAGPLHPYIEAVWYARMQGWDKLEREQYIKLGVVLDRLDGPLDPETADALCRQFARTRLVDDIDAVLRVHLKALDRLPPESPAVFDFIDVFEDRMNEPGTAWKTRLQLEEFLRRLERLDPTLARSRRHNLTKCLPDWALDYQSGEPDEEFPLRSRAVFTALTAAAWSTNSKENVDSGLDGAFICVVDKLMEASRAGWLGPFLEQLSTHLAGMQMYRRLSCGTLYRIGEILTRTRRRVYPRDPAKAVAITSLEEAIHRPHRMQLGRGPVELELELPGPRGFGSGIRLRVYDISRDGCLAVMQGPARFEETTAGEEFRLDRGFGRTYAIRRLNGVLQHLGGAVAVQPGTALVLRDTRRSDREWAAIESASAVRFSTDVEHNLAWLAFHFDRVLPEVQQELEDLVYSAA